MGLIGQQVEVHRRTACGHGRGDRRVVRDRRASCSREAPPATTLTDVRLADVQLVRGGKLMLGTIYVGLAGMKAYSKGLDIISNNVANLNTTGSKPASRVSATSSIAMAAAPRAAVRARDHGGAGVQVNDDQHNFHQGDLHPTDDRSMPRWRATASSCSSGTASAFTRVPGSSNSIKDGVLIESTAGAKVMMSSETSSIGSLHIDPHRVSQPQATTTVNIAGNLARTGGAQFDLDLTVVNDTSGVTQTLREVHCAAMPRPIALDRRGDEYRPAKTVLGSGTLLFNADGTPSADNVAINVTETPDGLPAFTFTFNFGAAGSYAGVTSLLSNTNSQVQLLRQDGLAFGTLDRDQFRRARQPRSHLLER